MNKREEEKLKKQQERLEKEIARTKAMSTFFPFPNNISKSSRHR